MLAYAFLCIFCRSMLSISATYAVLRCLSVRLCVCHVTSFNCLSLACRACDYVYINYVRRSRSSSCRLLRPINCQTYITLRYMYCAACVVQVAII